VPFERGSLRVKINNRYALAGAFSAYGKMYGNRRSLLLDSGVL
jgi:hypothetical protein